MKAMSPRGAERAVALTMRGLAIGFAVVVILFISTPDGVIDTLDDVEPTSHVIQVENVLRADEPRPSLPRERALEQAPSAADGGFAVPPVRA